MLGRGETGARKLGKMWATTGSEATPMACSPYEEKEGKLRTIIIISNFFTNKNAYSKIAPILIFFCLYSN